MNKTNLLREKEAILSLLNREGWQKVEHGMALDGNDLKSLQAFKVSLSKFFMDFDSFLSVETAGSGSHIHCQECGAYVIETPKGLVFPSMGAKGDALEQLRLFEAVHGKSRGVYKRVEPVDEEVPVVDVDSH